MPADANLYSCRWAAVSRPLRPADRRGDTIPNSRPNRQLDHVLRHDPAGVLRPRGPRVVAAPVSDHRALVVDFDIAAP